MSDSQMALTSNASLAGTANADLVAIGSVPTNKLRVPGRLVEFRNTFANPR
jgi:hypothetical protein